MKKTPYQKARASKTFVTLFYCFLGILLFGGIVVASTVITNNGITTPTGTYTNITADNINSVLYVQAGNATDLNVTINKCPSTGCKVIIPCGNYNLDYEVTLKDNLDLIGSGECTIINRTSLNGKFKQRSAISNLRIADLRFNGNNISGNAIDLDGGYKQNIRIENIHIIEIPSRAIQINGSNILIQNNLIENVSNGIGISKNEGGDISRNDEIKIINNRITSEFNSSSPSEYGEGIEINTHAYGKAIIDNNIIIGFREEGIDCNIGYCIISNNYIEMVGDETRDSNGITVNSELGKAQISNIVSNIIVNIPSTNGRGIQVEDFSLSANIVGNSLVGYTSGTYGITVDFANHTSIFSNYFENLNTGIILFNTADNGSKIGGNSFQNVSDELSGQVEIDLDNLFFKKKMTFIPSGESTWEFLNNGLDKRMSVMYNTSIVALDFRDRSDNIILSITESGRLKFALGQFIDNIVDGWLRITGSLEVTGDLNVTGTATIANINGVLYVQAGNASDINQTISECPSTGCTVIVPVGSYALDEQITYQSNLTIINHGLIYWNTDATPTIYTDNQSSTNNFIFYGANIDNFKLVNYGEISPRLIFNTAVIENVFVTFNGRNIQIIGGKISNSNSGYKLINVTNSSIINVLAENSGGVDTECSSDLIIDNIQGFAVGGEAVDLNYGDENILISNINYDGIDSSQETIDINRGRNIQVNNVLGRNAIRIVRGNTNAGTYDPRWGQCVVGEISANITAFNLNCINCANNDLGQVTGSVVHNEELFIYVPFVGDGNTKGITYELEDGGSTARSHFLIKSSGDEIFEIQSRSDGDLTSMRFKDDNGEKFLIDEDGDLILGDGTNQRNITLTSPDGTEYSCGVANGGALSCT